MALVTNIMIVKLKKNAITCVALSPSSLSDCADLDRHKLEHTPFAVSLHGRVRSVV